MEAPYDATKSAHDMLNFSGSASDMMAAMKAAGIVMPETEAAAMKVAAAPPSKEEPTSCGDPSCSVDHSHGGHDHGHSHGHSGENADCCANAPANDQSHAHNHDHGEKSCCSSGQEGTSANAIPPAPHDHGHAHASPSAPPQPAVASGVETDASPEGVLAVDASETSLTLTWAAIPKAVKYELEWRPHRDGISSSNTEEVEDWVKLGSKGFASPLPPKQKNGLTPGSAFDFRMRARDSVDWFPWSSVNTHATLAPGTPRLPAVTLHKAEAGALTVAWAAVDPEDYPASTKTLYELQIREAKVPQWTTVSKALAGAVVRKRNLDPLGRYFFRVRPVWPETETKDSAASGSSSGSSSNSKELAFSPPNEQEFKPIPPANPRFKQLLGNQLMDARGKTYPLDEKLAGKVVALYFSASWCGPCQQFTPQLATLYAQAQAAKLAFEVVFVSADRDEASFKGYLNHMPWCAVPFAAPERTSTPAQFQVAGIPHLKVFGPNGQLLDDDAIKHSNLSVAAISNWVRGATAPPQQQQQQQAAHQHSSGGGC